MAFILGPVGPLIDAQQQREIVRGTANVLETEVRNSFRNSRTPEGRSWAPLTRATLAERRRKGFPPGPLLVRTGALARAYFSALITGTRITLGVFAPGYSSFHVEGTDNMPARPFIPQDDELPRAWFVRIDSVFQRVLN